MNRYLLDTHVVLWIAVNSPLLSEIAKHAILDINAEKYVSVVSVWETAIKLGTSKLNFDGGLPEFYKIIDDNGFKTLHIEKEHLLILGRLPIYHKDPFDRLIVSTALAEKMRIITIDENIQKYDVPWIW